MKRTIRVAYLADTPEACPLLAAAFKAEWAGHYAGRTADAIAADFRACLHTDRLPLALVAADGQEVCGTVTLRQDGLTTHPHLTPWVAAFYVPPHRRGAGGGGALLAAAEWEAARLGYGRLYTGTGRAASLFLRRGWTALEAIEHHGEAVTVLHRELPADGLAGRER